jgi:putative hydrolase of the HAD superfamily
MIKALLFDLDDTLFKTYHPHREAVRLCCEEAVRHCEGWTAASLQEAFSGIYAELEAQLETGVPGRPGRNLFRAHVWQETVTRCELPPELSPRLAALYQAERRRRYRLFPDVVPILDRLAERYTLVLVTNGLGEIQREKVHAAGLERWFDHVVISGEVGSWKPDAAIFRRALELAEAEPYEAVMIGDSLERDIRGAAELGIRTLWLRRYDHLLPIDGLHPDATLNGCEALYELLAGWDGEPPGR